MSKMMLSALNLAECVFLSLLNLVVLGASKHVMLSARREAIKTNSPKSKVLHDLFGRLSFTRHCYSNG